MRNVDLAVTDVPAARAFFTDVWRLEAVTERDGVVNLRASGSAFHVLSLRAARVPGLIRIGLDAADRPTVDGIFETVMRLGRPTDGRPRVLNTPGGGYGFGVQDPEGRNFAVVCEAADHPALPGRADHPSKVSHVNLNSGANDETFAFMSEAFGFALADRTRQFRFIRCNSDHHSLVLGFNNESTLNHIAFEMPDLDSVMRGIGRMRDHGYPVEWGPGRHGPGNNVFAYFCGPEDLPLEYTAEMQQVDESYRIRPPEEWGWPPGRVDHWGITPGPSARVKSAQHLFRFTPQGYVLDQ